MTAALEIEMEELFIVPRLPGAPDADGVRCETVRYRVTPRPRKKFKAVLDAGALFGHGGGQSVVTTRVSDAGLQLHIAHNLAGMVLDERLDCEIDGDRLRCRTFQRELGRDGELVRLEKVTFAPDPLGLPPASYPEVMLPFLMRGQPLDGTRRPVYSWTNDRFIARVYYEVRRRVSVAVPAGRFDAALVWMYPDLNDWISLGGVVTRLAKPLLPRYDIWFELAPPHRVLRFEGPYGPPAAPEIVLEMAG